MAKTVQGKVPQPTDPSEFPKREVGRSRQETPYDQLMVDAAHGASYKIPVENEDEAKALRSQLYSAARAAGRYLRVKEKDGNLHFMVNHTPTREVKYTAADIRAWAVEAGLPVYESATSRKLPKETREAFWKAVKEAEDSDRE